MATPGSAWRANDVTAYDRMRTAADLAIAGILQLSHAAPAEAIEEAARLRQRVLAVDGLDRAAVEEMSDELRDLIKTLSRTA